MDLSRLLEQSSSADKRDREYNIGLTCKLSLSFMIVGLEMFDVTFVSKTDTRFSTVNMFVRRYWKCTVDIDKQSLVLDYTWTFLTSITQHCGVAVPLATSL